jgi:hypothetical protein
MATEGGIDPEILVNISFRLPNAHREVLAEHLMPVIQEGIKAGGASFHLNLQPYDPDGVD